MSAQDRYEKLEIKTLSNGQQVYKSALPKSIKPDTLTDMQIVVGDAERLDVIAHNVYGSAESWWKIAAANTKINGSLFLKPGTILYIPKG
jgi:hypothetical protein